MRFVLTLIAALTPAIAGANALTGNWMTEKKGVIIRIYECGDQLCGRTIWLKKPNWKDGSPRLDSENPDPALRSRPWCGIEVVTGLKKKKDGVWEGGKVYDPKSGSSYDFDLKTSGAGLKARGYLKVPLLGKTDDWTKADISNITPCPPVD